MHGQTDKLGVASTELLIAPISMGDFFACGEILNGDVEVVKVDGEVGRG